MSMTPQVGGQTVTIEKIDSVKKHPNFLSPHAFIDVMLPVEEEFLPPLNIRILDNRSVYRLLHFIFFIILKEFNKTF